MMQFIMIPTLFGIVTLGLYKFFELIICRKERLLLIEKLGDKLTPEGLNGQLNISFERRLSFSALKFSCLFMGMGLGLLLAFFINAEWGYTMKEFRVDDEVLYGSCLLLFGGLGLLIAFLVELNVDKKE